MILSENTSALTEMAVVSGGLYFGLLVTSASYNSDAQEGPKLLNYTKNIVILKKYNVLFCC